jgi:hypothetical protein
VPLAFLFAYILLNSLYMLGQTVEVSRTINN